MNGEEIQRLAVAIAALRPVEARWPVASLRTWITRNLSAWPYELAAAELGYVAALPDSLAPGRVLEAGPWRHRVTDRTGPAPADPVEACEVCSRPWSTHEPVDGHAFRRGGFVAAGSDAIARARAIRAATRDGRDDA